MAKSVLYPQMGVHKGTPLRMKRLSPPRSRWGWNLSVQAQAQMQLLGLLIAVAGAILFLSLRTPEPLPWLVKMTGWTAPLIALGVMLVGAVLVLGERAGYWSVEALLGGELLILGLQIGAFAWHNPIFQWNLLPQDGSFGGLVGGVMGGLLVAGFGQGVAGGLAVLLCVAGVILLLRFTPLYYPTAYVWHFVAWLAALWVAWSSAPATRQSGTWQPAGTPLPTTANFVKPGHAMEGWEEDWDDGLPVTAKKTRRSAPVVVAPVQAAGPAKRSGRAPKSAPRPADLPQMELLSVDSGSYGSVDVDAIQTAIETTLEDFGVPVRVVHVESGPTVTQFGVEPLFTEQSGKRRKVRVNRIVNLADDLALALAAPSVRIEAPVPGRPYVGIEVPNATKVLVSLRGLLESSVMRRFAGGLALALGRDTAGAPVIMDLTRAPHLLIAGATGSGKSVCINTIITSLLMQHGPESLRFVMVDPKMVELPGYNGIPHLLGKVITDMDQVMGALTWLLLQMDDRYQLFREAGVRNIDGYNELARQRKRGAQALEPLPYIVLIVDELADLMMTAADDVERQLCRLAQKARATGIHLILATQRPSTDVVTGLIKANFPSRIAFAVTSQIDSRVILDTPGAEHLLGRGDMLLLRPDMNKLLRVQGCYVEDGEIVALVRHWQNIASEAAPMPAVAPWNGLIDRMDEEDELMQDAIDVLRGMRTCSASMLQRKLRIGYPKAARLMEQLADNGIVGPDLGGGQGREVLLKQEEPEAEAEAEYL